MIIDWTNLKRPEFSEERYYWFFESSVISDNISESEKRQATREGLKQLVAFYGKKFPETYDYLVDDSLTKFESYLDPRPVCHTFKALVSISKANLDALKDRTYDVDNLVIVNTTTKEFEDNIKEIVFAVTRHSIYTHMWDSFLFVDNFLVDLDYQSKSIAEYPSYLQRRALLNGEIYESSESDSLQLLFTESGFFAGAILNNIPLIKGDTSLLVGTTPLDSRFINNLLFQIEEVAPILKKANKSREAEHWQSFYERYIKYGLVTFGSPAKELNEIQKAVNTLDNIKNNYLERVDNKFKAALEHFKEIPEQLLGNNCGPLSFNTVNEIIYEDIDRIAMSKDAKDAQDILLDNAVFKATIHQRNIDVTDYVGDIIFDDFPGLFPSGPTSLNDVYDNVLNYVSIDLLIKKSIQCLLQRAEFPDLWKLCIDIYVPFSLRLPDNINIPDLFGFISKLVIKLFLLLLQEVLFFLIDLLIDALDKCIRGEGRDINQGTTAAASIFADNTDVVDVFLAKKVYDNLGDFSDATPLIEDEFTDTRSLVQDITAALTPQELCMLLSGTASENVYRIVLCIIQTRYPSMSSRVDTTEKVRSIFMSLGSLFPSELCEPDRIIPVPTNPNLCITNEQVKVREYMLNNKYANLDKKELAKQLEGANTRRLGTINKLRSMLESNDAFGEAIFGDQDREEFIISLTPCARDNEPMKHMIELSTDSMVDSLSAYFVQAVLGSLGLASQLSDGARTKYLQALRNNNFVEVDNGGFSFGNKIEYQTGISGQQLINLGSTILETDLELPAEFPIGPESRQTYFKSISPQLTDNDYNNVFINLTEFITAKAAASKYFSSSYESLLTEFNTIVSSTTGTSALYENCWANGENVRDGINDTYFDKDCETRDTSLYTQYAIVGLIRLYIRTVMIEFFFDNLAIITQFNSSDLNNTFIVKFIRQQLAPIFSSILNNEEIDDIDTLVNEELSNIYQEFKTIFENQVNPAIGENNIINYFIDSLELYKEDPKFTIAQRFHLVADASVDTAKDEVLLKLSLIYNKTLGLNPTRVDLVSVTKKFKTDELLTTTQTDRALNALKETLKASRSTKLLLGTAIPTNDILSIIAIYNVTRIRNNIFEQLFILNENVIKNLENADNFTYRNQNFERESKVNQANSVKNDDKKKKLKQILDD